MQQKVEVVKFQKLWPLGQSDVFNVHWSEPAAVCNEKYKILTESCWAGLIQPVMMVTRVWSLYLMICFTVKTRPHSQLSSCIFNPSPQHWTQAMHDDNFSNILKVKIVFPAVEQEWCKVQIFLLIADLNSPTWITLFWSFSALQAPLSLASPNNQVC